MTFNILWEDLPVKDRPAWINRKEAIAKIFKINDIDVAGVQEPNHQQVIDLAKLLPEYSWYGIGLENGLDKGSFNAIFYKKKRFLIKPPNASSFYLSSTPNEPSLGWNAHFHRGVTWIKCFDNISQKTFYVFNTHFDYHSELARNESALFLRKQIRKIAKDEPFIVTGDFNTFVELGGNTTYALLTDPSENGDLASLYDAEGCSETLPCGAAASWGGFEPPSKERIKPDYLFVSSHFKVLSHEIVDQTFQGDYPSDHLPIIVEIELT